MNNEEALAKCLTKVIEDTLLGKDREASRSLLSYIEGRVAERDLEGIDALLICCRDDTIVSLTPRHKVAILRTCHRVRIHLKEYDTCLKLWNDDLEIAGLARMLAGIQNVKC